MLAGLTGAASPRSRQYRIADTTSRYGQPAAAGPIPQGGYEQGRQTVGRAAGYMTQSVFAQQIQMNQFAAGHPARAMHSLFDRAGTASRDIL